MPAGDGTGPAGFGPMTGRAAGYCAGFLVPGFANPLPGRGWGMGFGRARGWRRRNWFYATGLPAWARFGPGAYPTADPTQEAEVLKAQARHLESVLEQIRTRLAQVQASAQPAQTP